MLNLSRIMHLNNKKYIHLIFAILSFVLVVIISCTQTVKQEETTPPKPSGMSGMELAKIHCGSCHKFPDPSLLPKSIWQHGVLPKMALRLGHGNYMGELISFSKEEIIAVISSGVYPESPVIASEDWIKIVDYYLKNAPENLPKISKKQTSELEDFRIYKKLTSNDNIVLTQFNYQSNSVFTSTSDNQNVTLSLLNSNIKPDTVLSESPVVKYAIHKEYGKVQLEIGLLDPSELSLGKLKAGNKTLLENLHRPVDMLVADVNEDGTEDFIIANFGNLKGSLSWYDGKTFKETILSDEPGARVIYHIDFDRDGKKDILALMTQGRESVLFFKSLGKGKYKIMPLLTFPPVYGSSYFEVIDFDKDGDYDIIYTNGDNADYSIVKKPYHGLRIFLNDKENKLHQKYFYPINGASKVVSHDFDQDGDYDLAVISYFPDEVNNEGFLYFKQENAMKFSVKSMPNISKQKWLTLDYGDFDNNGSTDIILGTLLKRKESLLKTESSLVILLNELDR